MDLIPELDCHDKNELNPSVWEPFYPVKNEAVFLKSLPTYDEFFREIFLKNQLCLLGSQNTDSWSCKKLWVTSLGNPNLEYLTHHFGSAKAPVANCNAEEFSSHPKTEMLVSEFMDYWQRYQETYSPSLPSLYLKDWHFTRDFPSYNGYTPPSLLCSDWLNEFWDARQDEMKGDDYRFVYMGPKNTWTPFHSDVLRSYSWSANICGRKKWIFFPPGLERKLCDTYGQLVFDLTDPSLQDEKRFPLAKNVMDEAVVVIQNPGQILFVPSGWHHQVFNLEDTISINHNWVNGASVHLTWHFLQSQMSKVKREIADCAGMEGFHSQCQKILKADSGMNYGEFYNFLATIASHRIWALQRFYRHVVECKEKDASSPPQQTGSEDGVEKRADILCLWTAAQHLSKTRSCQRSGEEEEKGPEASSLHHRNDYSPPSVEVSSSKVKTFDWCSSSRGNGGTEGVRSCPMWSHCGPRLCVFDLHRIRAVLSDLTSNPEWNSLRAEGEMDPVLAEEEVVLMSSIQQIVEQSQSCLSLL